MQTSNGCEAFLRQNLENCKSKEALEAYLAQTLSPIQQRELARLLENPAALETFLNQPKAKALLQKLMEDENYG